MENQWKQGVRFWSSSVVRAVQDREMKKRIISTLSLVLTLSVLALYRYEKNLMAGLSDPDLLLTNRPKCVLIANGIKVASGICHIEFKDHQQNSRRFGFTHYVCSLRHNIQGKSALDYPEDYYILGKIDFDERGRGTIRWTNKEDSTEQVMSPVKERRSFFYRQPTCWIADRNNKLCILNYSDMFAE